MINTSANNLISHPPFSVVELVQPDLIKSLKTSWWPEMSHQPDGKNMQQDFCCNHLSQPRVGKDLDHGHCDLDLGMVPHHDHYYSLILVNILMLY